MSTIDASAFLRDLHALQLTLTLTVPAQAMKDAVNSAVADAKGTTLFNDRTGRLRASISGKANGPRGSFRATAKYARFVTNGTRFMKARPFMQHAFRTGEQTLDYGVEVLTDAAIQRFNR